jgi:ATP-dependent exoDNAse (exonuclease V) beta subunit
MNIYKELSVFNKVKYHDEPHLYFIGDKQLVSGTTFVGMYKEKFDSKSMAEKVAKKKGISVEEVLAEWDFKGGIARTKGTLLHAFAENYWMNKVFPVDLGKHEEQYPSITERYEECKRMFLDFYNEAKDGLYPVALELVVADEETGLSGMIDGLFWSKKLNGLIIGDYKTSREINSSSKYKKRMKAPINFLHECELVAYSIQLYLYKYIIEKNTNLKIVGCFLIHIHEEQEHYSLIECLKYDDIIKLLIKDYLLNKKV